MSGTISAVDQYKESLQEEHRRLPFQRVVNEESHSFNIRNKSLPLPTKSFFSSQCCPCPERPQSTTSSLSPLVRSLICPFCFSWILNTQCTIGISLCSIQKIISSTLILDLWFNFLRKRWSPLWKAGSMLPMNHHNGTLTSSYHH